MGSDKFSVTLANQKPSMEFQFVEREIIKCQLPTYIGKNKLMCCNDVIK